MRRAIVPERRTVRFGEESKAPPLTLPLSLRSKERGTTASRDVFNGCARRVGCKGA